MCCWCVVHTVMCRTLPWVDLCRSDNLLQRRYLCTLFYFLLLFCCCFSTQRAANCAKVSFLLSSEQWTYKVTQVRQTSTDKCKCQCSCRFLGICYLAYTVWWALPWHHIFQFYVKLNETLYRVSQKTGPQTHNHNSVKSYQIFSLQVQDSIVKLQLNGY